MATHSSVLAWRIPGTGEPGGLPCMGSHRVGNDCSDLAAAAAAAADQNSPSLGSWEPYTLRLLGVSPGGSEVKASAHNAGDLGSIPGSGRSLGEGYGNPLQYSCLENPMDGESWWATIHRIAKSWSLCRKVGASDFTFSLSWL